MGDGVAAVILRRVDRGTVVVTGSAWSRGVGINCDAHHVTAPDPSGVAAAMHDVHERAGVPPEAIDLVVAPGTGAALNDTAGPTGNRAAVDRRLSKVLTFSSTGPGMALFRPCGGWLGSPCAEHVNSLLHPQFAWRRVPFRPVGSGAC
ncbi:hypothetical protein [Actinomadura napierensis]|uniref:Beta-ketoacyl synthase C-terminal domain-containing protein n=1 Tax=Actinomadura napierensis TaxID=267854 RepID=A0ABN2ZL49_9ACTN